MNNVKNSANVTCRKKHENLSTFLKIMTMKGMIKNIISRYNFFDCFLLFFWHFQKKILVRKFSLPILYFDLLKELSSRSSSLFQRRRDFEREREADAKDRQREQQEIEELKKQIIAENQNIENVEEEARRRHNEQVQYLMLFYIHFPFHSKFLIQEEALLRKLRADSGSPNPHRPLGQKPLHEKTDKEEESEESESDSESDASAEEAKNINSTYERLSNWKAGGFFLVKSSYSCIYFVSNCVY